MGRDIVPKAPQKGFRFKVGVPGSRRRPNYKVVAFVFAKCSQSVQRCSQVFAKRPQAPACVAHFWDSKIIPKPRTVVTFGLVSDLRVSKVPTVTGIGGVRVAKRRTESANSHRDRGVRVAKRRTVITFGLASGLRVSTVSTVAGIGGVRVAKRRTVVTFGLVSDLRVSKVPTVSRLVFASQSANSHRDWGVLVAKRRNVVTFRLVFCPQREQEREERAEGEERGEMRGERRGEERRGERREERREERRGERREERRGERREERRD